MRGKNTKAQEKNKNYKMILFTGPSTHTLIYITHPPSIPSPPSLVIKIQFFFLTRFYFTTAGEMGGYLLNSSLPLQPALQTLKPVNYCKELTPTHS